MKKEYMAPHTAVYKVEQSLPIAGSLNPDSATFFDEDATGAAMSKQSGDWDIWGTDDDGDDYDY
jgi:hypothetical protein